MIYKIASPYPGHIRIVFELPSCMWADRIFLTGDFNQWDPTSLPMQPDRSGVWRAIVDLPRGTRAEFRYLVDGQWHTDFHADGFTENEFGTQNSVVVAELPEAKQEPALVSGLIREEHAKGAFPEVPSRPRTRYMENLAA
jgi:hypothetical protein